MTAYNITESFSRSMIIHKLSKSGAYEPPKAAKEHVSSVPSEYKFKHGIGLPAELG